MKAKYTDLCPECERAIWVGDEIEAREFEYGWVHVVCPKPPRVKVCPSCWMEIALSGEHDCEAGR